MNQEIKQKLSIIANRLQESLNYESEHGYIQRHKYHDKFTCRCDYSFRQKKYYIIIEITNSPYGKTKWTINCSTYRLAKWHNTNFNLPAIYQAYIDECIEQIKTVHKKTAH